MFETVCHMVVNEFGKDTLIPVQSIDEQSKVKPLRLVVKEKTRTFFFFTKYSYRPTEYQLNDLLEDKSSISVEESDDDLKTDYETTKLFSLNGKCEFGVSLDVIKQWSAGINLGASKKVNLRVKFGKVTRTEVPIPVLRQKLTYRKLDLKHDFIKQVRKDKTKVLCLVTAVLRTKKGHISIDRATNTNVDVSAKTLHQVSALVNASVSGETHQKLDLNGTTVLAYKVKELYVNVQDGGSLTIMEEGLHGGFEDSIQNNDAASRKIILTASASHQRRFAASGPCHEGNLICGATSMHNVLVPPPWDDLSSHSEAISPDMLGRVLYGASSPSAIFPWAELSAYSLESQECSEEVFQAILDLPEKDRNQLTSIILNMMSAPRDIQIFAEQVKKLESREPLNILVQELEKQLLIQKESWLYLFELAGLTVQVSGELNVPRDVTPLLKCFGMLFDALSDLEEEELDLIGKCAPQTAPALFATFKAGLSNFQVIVSDVETILKDDGASELLKQLGYSVSEQEIIPPKDNLLTIDEVYVVMFALWGQKSK